MNSAVNELAFIRQIILPVLLLITLRCCSALMDTEDTKIEN